MKDPQKGGYLGGLDLIKADLLWGVSEELVLREGNVMTEQRKEKQGPGMQNH